MGSLRYCEYKTKETVQDCQQYCTVAPPIVSRAVSRGSTSTAPTGWVLLVLLADNTRYLASGTAVLPFMWYRWWYYW